MLLHSCTVCKLFFLLSHPVPPLLIWIINLLTRATLLAMAKCIYHFFGKSILGDPGAVSWVRKNGDESFQEREKEPLGLLLTTSFTTYSNACLWFGTHKKIISCPTRGQHLLRCSRDLLISGRITANSTVRHTCLALAGELSSAKLPGTHQTKEILYYSDSRKKPEVAWKWGINGPCGKFKITNTVDDQVDLTPGDIPDDGLSEEELEKLTVAQLKF